MDTRLKNRRTKRPKKLRPKKEPLVAGVLVNALGGPVAFARKLGLNYGEVSIATQGTPPNGRPFSGKVRRALEAELKLPWEILRKPILSAFAELAARQGTPR